MNKFIMSLNDVKMSVILVKMSLNNVNFAFIFFVGNFIWDVVIDC
jgi:hypothetical protein